MEVIDDYDKAMCHVLNHPKYSLYDISVRLRADHSIALAAVSRYGLNIKYIDYSLLYDIEIINAAIKSNRRATEFMPVDLPLETIISMLDALIIANENAFDPYNDSGPITNIERSSWQVAQIYRNTREMIARIVPHCGRAIQHTEFTDDDELALVAVSHDIRAYEYISDRLKQYPNIISVIINHKMSWALPCLLKHIPDTILNDNDTMWVLMQSLSRTMDAKKSISLWYTEKDEKRRRTFYIISDSYKKLNLPIAVKSDIYAIVVDHFKII